jgi:hypothetical protein
VARGRGALQGRIAPGGARSRAFLSSLLGLEVTPREDGTRVVAAGWMGDHAEVEVAGPEGQWVVLHLERFQAGQKRLVASEHLSLHFRGEQVWPELERRLRRVRLGATTLEEVAAAIAGDPDMDPARDRVPRASAGDQAHYDAQSLLSTWDSSETWSQFFAVAEIAHNRLDSFDVFERGTIIQHCDRDCLLVTPKGPVPMVERVFFPWLDRTRAIGRPPRRRDRTKQGDACRHGSMVTTDLRERDVVMGSLGKLEKVLDHVLARGVGDMLFLSCTCVPFVTGEDVGSLVERYRHKVDRPFFFLTTTPQSSIGVFREVLVTARQAAEAASGEPEPHAVNLIGYPPEPALDELRGLLGEAGVRVNAVFIPEMDFSAIAELPRAPLHVLYPNAPWQSTYDQLLFESRIRSVTPPAPFGRHGVEAWLAQVVAAAGVRADAGAIVERAFEPHRAAFESLRAEAAGHRLGFVVGSDDVHRLCNPAATWGVPLLSMVEELGFGVDVLVRASDRKTAYTSARKIQAVLAQPERHTFKAFGDRERLARLLADGAFDAVYSDHLFDGRLSSAGKAQFSLQEFEKGLAGAIRTAERLLEVCRFPLYRRYRRYLAPEVEGPRGGTP